MAAWTLTDEEWDALDKIRFGTTDKTVFRNARAFKRRAKPPALYRPRLPL
jgi:hypothetical protein